ncbi:hypothetical protein [Chitinophaga nivalis]|uniref:Uncharacterized protein n=1 Tax=Chitinophaga nivalis TaxID=2991709 RepID=A0ABT3IMZ3_9BACT|nr:hypothetical protein [Chitinophaga nivalis]MCW3464972.1 hypothetical protein [Chitinophaga nivalis]MCW3485336.1 hypothetical protein [Chitinophaga nivalis]
MLVEVNPFEYTRSFLSIEYNIHVEELTHLMMLLGFQEKNTGSDLLYKVYERTDKDPANGEQLVFYQTFSALGNELAGVYAGAPVSLVCCVADMNKILPELERCFNSYVWFDEFEEVRNAADESIVLAVDNWLKVLFVEEKGVRIKSDKMTNNEGLDKKPMSAMKYYFGNIQLHSGGVVEKVFQYLLQQVHVYEVRDPVYDFKNRIIASVLDDTTISGICMYHKYGENIYDITGRNMNVLVIYTRSVMDLSEILIQEGYSIKRAPRLYYELLYRSGKISRDVLDEYEKMGIKCNGKELDVLYFDMASFCGNRHLICRIVEEKEGLELVDILRDNILSITEMVAREHL